MMTKEQVAALAAGGNVAMVSFNVGKRRELTRNTEFNHHHAYDTSKAEQQGDGWLEAYQSRSMILPERVCNMRVFATDVEGLFELHDCTCDDQVGIGYFMQVKRDGYFIMITCHAISENERYLSEMATCDEFDRPTPHVLLAGIEKLFMQVSDKIHHGLKSGVISLAPARVSFWKLL